MKGLIEFIARTLVDHPDRVQVDERAGGRELRLLVDPSDLGKLIGRRGRTAKSMRTLLQTAAGRRGRVELEITDGTERVAESSESDLDDAESSRE
jgi:predicted RNA-binding protein YlqC (UPF0109 family)